MIVKVRAFVLLRCVVTDKSRKKMNTIKLHLILLSLFEAQTQYRQSGSNSTKDPHPCLVLVLQQCKVSDKTGRSLKANILGSETNSR